MWTVIAFISTNILSFWLGLTLEYHALKDRLKDDKDQEAEA